MGAFQLPEMVWTPSPNYSSRGGQKVRLIVAHSCEGSASGAISWFAQSRSRVSAQAVLSADGKRMTRMVEWQNKAWHAVAFNGVSEGIEMGGFEAKGFDEPEWIAMASVIAWRLKVNGLPPLWTPGGAGEGFCSHRDLGAAGGGHSDPTTDPAIWNHFRDLVTKAYAEAHGDVGVIFEDVMPPTLPPVGWVPSGTVRHDHEIGSLEWAQLELNALGFAKPPLLVDGLWGPNTRAALFHFQMAARIEPDGVWGPESKAALIEAAAHPFAPS